jgi:hypothetical protein
VPQVEIPQRETLSHAQNYLKKKNKKRGLKWLSGDVQKVCLKQKKFIFRLGAHPQDRKIFPNLKKLEFQKISGPSHFGERLLYLCKFLFLDQFVYFFF